MSPIRLPARRLRAALLPTLALATLPFVVPTAHAQTVTFEGVASPNNPVGVGPFDPYSEAGYTFTPLTDEAAVIDRDSVLEFPGNGTDFFGFAPRNFIFLTRNTGGAFALRSLDIGPLTFGSGTTNIVILGGRNGVLTGFFASDTLTTATTLTFGNTFANVDNVLFFNSDITGIDNVVLQPIPEPSEWAAMGMAGASLCGLMVRARRRKNVPTTA